ncbi:hypothetical protein MBO43_0008680 [Klebsiella pneumoniae]
MRDERLNIHWFLPLQNAQDKFDKWCGNIMMRGPISYSMA